MRSRLAAPLLWFLLLPACSKTPAGAECSTDTECSGTGAVCLSNKCFQFVASCNACSQGACTDRCLAGVPGPTGDAGAPGPAGATGATGVAGPQGAVGAAGPAGMVGPTGPAGPTGMVGPMGPVGPMGSMGPAGPMGAAGPAGPAGATGAIGPQGPVGPAGATGATGATGLLGPVGPAGSSGAQGVPGQPGPAGNLYGEAAASFIGFTAATTTGNAGSRENMHAICAAQYTGSHLCHMAEYALATPATTVPAGAAWVDGSGYIGTSTYEQTLQVATMMTGRYIAPDPNYNCANWTTTLNYGAAVAPAGAAEPACNTARPLACCVTPYREKFMGLAGSVNGNQGGREQMHSICAAQYAGAHMCHVAEYYRAGSAAPLPAGGAWADGNGYVGGSTYEQTLQVAPVNVGRYISPDPNYNCANWTTTLNYGAAVAPAGPAEPACNTTRPVACCQ